jgi:hypothetical protein
MEEWCLRSKLGAGLFLLFFLGTAGCSRGQSTTPAQTLFVAVAETGSLNLFAISASGSDPPVATIKESPPDKPIDVSVDSFGEIFVANENGNVKMYAGRNHQYQRARTLEGPNTRIQHPLAIAADMAGSFYLADAGDGHGHGRIEWFVGGLTGNVTPNRVVSGPHTRITDPVGVALDASGRGFVSDQASNKVLVFDADASGDVAPVATLVGLHSPGRVFVDQQLNVYVINRTDNSIAVFIPSGPQSWTLNATFRSNALHDSKGVGTDATGRIAVAATGGVFFFPPNARGTIDPIVNLRGATPMNPSGLYIH